MKHLTTLLACLMSCVLLLCACNNTTAPVTDTDTAQTTVPSGETSATPSTGAPSTDGTAAPTDPLVEETFSPNIDYAVKASAKADSSFFSDAVFVGDSVSLKLTNYHMSNVCFDVNTAFLTSGSLGVANAMWDLYREGAVHPSYQGQTVTVVDGIAQTGKSKVYLMLGINDLGLYGVEDTVENFKTLTDLILEKSPNVTLYIQSVTPLLDDYYSLTNQKILEYNALISEYCREKGWYYVDVASVLRDANGCLVSEYCSDPDAMGIHFTDEGCRVWSEYLYTHTGL